MYITRARLRRSPRVQCVYKRIHVTLCTNYTELIVTSTKRLARAHTSEQLLLVLFIGDRFLERARNDEGRRDDASNTRENKTNTRHRPCSRPTQIPCPKTLDRERTNSLESETVERSRNRSRFSAATGTLGFRGVFMVRVTSKLYYLRLNVSRDGALDGWRLPEPRIDILD